MAVVQRQRMRTNDARRRELAAAVHQPTVVETTVVAETEIGAPVRAVGSGSDARKLQRVSVLASHA